MYEHRSKPLLPRLMFLRRMGRSAGFAVGIVLVAWGLGTLGYHGIEGLPWIDAQLEAAMILSGMGPINAPHTHAAKIFAALYALASGFLFLTVAGILFAPLLHRMIHRFHLELQDDEPATSASPPRRSRTRQDGNPLPDGRGSDQRA